MKHLPLLLLISYTTFVSGHGGCLANEDCAIVMNHTMSSDQTMDQECCAFLSYSEKGTNI
jgi:hypothetical protein